MSTSTTDRRTVPATPATVVAFATLRDLLQEHAVLCRDQAPAVASQAVALRDLANELYAELCQPLNGTAKQTPPVVNRPENASKPITPAPAPKQEDPKPAPKPDAPIPCTGSLTDEQLAEMGKAELLAHVQAHGIPYRTIGLSPSSLRADIRKAQTATPSVKTTVPEPKQDTPAPKPEPQKSAAQTTTQAPAPKQEAKPDKGEALAAYRALQAECKALGVNAKGTADQLKIRIAEAKAKAAAAANKTAPPTPVDATATGERDDRTCLTAALHALGVAADKGDSMETLAALLNARLMKVGGKVRVSICQ